MTVEEYRELWWDVVNFVDEFRRNPKMDVHSSVYNSAECNAYYAGLVEFLTKEQGVETPDWVFEKKYYLSDPLFPTKIKNTVFRMITIIETPLEFKTRNIYIGENTFFRC